MLSAVNMLTRIVYFIKTYVYMRVIAESVFYIRLVRNHRLVLDMLDCSKTEEYT